MAGKVDIINDGPNTTISVDGRNATITAGSSGVGGILSLKDASGNFWWGVLINAQNRTLTINKVLAPNQQGAYPVISLRGATGSVGIGGNGQNGDLGIFPAGVEGGSAHDDLNKAGVYLDGGNANMRLGGNNVAAGNLALYPKDASTTDLQDFDKASIHLNGHTGDILLANADCAEDFDIAESEEVEPGTVMVINEEGQLQQSAEAYDRRVAGVLSGAGDYKPGIVLDKKPSHTPRLPVALVGKVYCKVDAQYSAIAVGDLLTTSPTPGHAMKARDPQKAFGAVIGKALQHYTQGCGLIPILVALQ